MALPDRPGPDDGDTEPQASTTRDCVVVGASAGGVGALRALVSALPVSLDATVLVVLHVGATGPFLLPELLAHAGPLPARAAVDGERPRRGMIYVAPPDRHLSVDGRRLRVTRGPKENWARPSVDVLFRSAALHFGPSVIGIVLSGRLDDGTAGLWAVKQRGGVAIVQSPEQAEYPSMPQSALAHVPVDLTLPVEAIGAEVARLTREVLPVKERRPPPARMIAETTIARGASTSPQDVLTLGELSPNTCPECHGALVRIDEGSISRFRCHTGHAYSRQTLLEEVDKAIDASLWNAVRAIEERVFILRDMAAAARDGGREVDAVHLDVEVRAAERRASGVRASMAPSD